MKTAQEYLAKASLPASGRKILLQANTLGMDLQGAEMLQAMRRIFFSYFVPRQTANKKVQGLDTVWGAEGKERFKELWFSE